MESPLCPADDPDFRLIETFGFRPDHGVARLDLHLARLAGSAGALGIPFDRQAAGEMIARLEGDQPLRCRLTISATGEISLETAPMPDTVDRWVFRVHPQRLKSTDPWLQHKSTNRRVYDEARANPSDGIDEFVFLNERGHICEGTITNIVITTPDNRQLTPPTADGCLPGVFRQSLLDQGALSEATLTLEDLANARSIMLTNSLRGAIPAVWDPTDPARP